MTTDEGQDDRGNAGSVTRSCLEALENYKAFTYDECVRMLKESFPEYEIWTVPLAIGGYRWCGRLRSNHQVRSATDSPYWLAFEILNRD